MRRCTAHELARRWPGSLRPVALADPGPDLPEASGRLLAEIGLPRVLTIRCYNDLRIDFADQATPLSRSWERALAHGLRVGAMPTDWSRFWHLADVAYLQGGGWICIEERTGRLVVVDLDHADPIYLLAANLEAFYTTLAHFLEWSRATGGGPEATVRLRAALAEQDTVPWEELVPFWVNLIDGNLDGDPVDLVVRVDV